MLFRELRSLDSRQELMGRVDDILLSVMHMWINRTLPNFGAHHSLYDLLVRHYMSLRARAVGTAATTGGTVE
jgi:hypothetical protein